MSINETLRSSDEKKSLTHAEAKKLQKQRAENLKQKYGLDSFSHEDILKNEDKITEAVHESVQDTESELAPVEGNVAENLIKAAESGSDGDISAALNVAASYHSHSNSRVGGVLKKRRNKRVQKVLLSSL
jgi:hypothetical protein